MGRCAVAIHGAGVFLFCSILLFLSFSLKDLSSIGFNRRRASNIRSNSRVFRIKIAIRRANAGNCSGDVRRRVRDYWHYTYSYIFLGVRHHEQLHGTCEGICFSASGDNLIQIRISDHFVKLTYSVLVLSAIAALAMAWFLVPHLSDLHHRGNPSVWHPSVALFVAGVAAFINFSLECKSKNHLLGYSFKWTWVLVGIVCLWFSVEFESGINTAIYASIKSLSDMLFISARRGEILLSVTILTMGFAAFFALFGINFNRAGQWLFCLGIVSWAGVFTTGSWETKEALKILSPSLFLVSFIESMKCLYVQVSHTTSNAG